MKKYEYINRNKILFYFDSKFNDLSLSNNWENENVLYKSFILTPMARVFYQDNLNIQDFCNL